MSDPVSVAAGIVGLTAFAIQSSKALYDTIEKIKNNGRNVRELKEELTALSSVLKSLEETLAISEVDFGALQPPLLRCGRLCQEYSVLIGKCSAHAGSGRFSLRDFLMSTYKNKDIIELRALLAAYKSTIAIALADANIRQVNVTVKLLEEYKHTIEDTASDLQELLQKYDEPVHNSSLPQDTAAQPLDVQPSEIAEERASIEDCLRICERISKHIDEVREESFVVQGNPQQNGQNGVTIRRVGQADRITSQSLDDAQIGIRYTSATLRARLQEVNHRLAKISRQPPTDGDPSTGAKGTAMAEEDLDSIRQCLSICQEATEQAMSDRINVFGDVSLDDESDQVVVSTFGDLISAKNIKAGIRSKQLLGQMSDASLQHISTEYAVRHNELARSGQNRSAKADNSRTQFAGRYGQGQTLS